MIIKRNLQRIEPIGYDSKRNAYWFIGGALSAALPQYSIEWTCFSYEGDRLWIQRVPPRAPRPKALKRKRAPEKARDKKAEIKSATPAKRVRLNVAPPTPSTPSGRHSRAAKDQAKLKLDMQARELAELNRQANSSTRSTRATRQAVSRTPSKPTISVPPRPLGTRASARLRGPQEEEEWQPIPDEWLNEGERSKTLRSKPAAKTGLESDEDSISDLTELSDDGADTSGSEQQHGLSPKNGATLTNGIEQVEDTEEKEPEVSQESSQDNFIEWETVRMLFFND